ncbi:MAG: DUF983 domain-containing protein [Algoriphagus sp.]|uniref:DUF983 domain-containing protein n=1 Tax=Algoriphagus sp. TaxID=1872435 RepID=UPI00181B2D5F|nr:DUF983 domain-containing protein [Algoriphagus sp.]NVJ86171.1 DUF983 domain-containing protein [Algoriphagus sp.]
MAKGLGQAMLGGKCPKCREGNMFPVPIVSFRKLTEVNKTCSVCNASFQPEPSFYDGAMYISYAFSVALFITVFVAINILIEKPELWMYLSTIISLNLLLVPVMLRYSKVLYLYGLGKLKYRGY